MAALAKWWVVFGGFRVLRPYSGCWQADSHLRAPLDFVEADRVVEAAQGDVTLVRPEEALAGRELADDVGGEDLAGSGAGANAGSKLDGGAEEIAVLGDGLAGVEADAHLER